MGAKKTKLDLLQAERSLFSKELAGIFVMIDKKDIQFRYRELLNVRMFILNGEW